MGAEERGSGPGGEPHTDGEGERGVGLGGRGWEGVLGCAQRSVVWEGDQALGFPRGTSFTRRWVKPAVGGEVLPPPMVAS